MKKILLSLFFVISILSCFVISASAESWLWPIPTSAYNCKTLSRGWWYNSSSDYHAGVDIAVRTGSNVMASKDGTVWKAYRGCSNYSCNAGACSSSTCSGNALSTKSSSGYCGESYGNSVFIKHSDGTISIYGHLSEVSVNAGDTVTQGQMLGKSGSSGYSTGPHLHFTITTKTSGYSKNSINNNPLNSGFSIGNSKTDMNSATITYITTANPGIVTPPDTEAPKFDFHGVDDNITISGTYKFWWKQTGYSNCDVNVYINDSHLATIYSDAGGFFSYNLDSTQYGNGGYTIKAILRDSSGAEKTVTRNITINNPKFDFHGVDDNITISGTYKFWWKQTGYGNSELKLYIDGGYIGILYPDDGGYFSYLFDSTQYTNDKHIIEAVLYNSAGQQKYVYRNFNIYNKKSEFKGWTESCTGGIGTITVCGWVYDELNPSIPVDIHIYIGGPVGTENVEIYTFNANQYRSDVNDVYNVGDYHGFLQTIPVKKNGQQQVCVYAVNPYTNEVKTFGEFSINITSDATAPIISDLKITDVTETGYTISCTVNDNVVVDKVLFPSWTTNNNGDDMIWHEGTINGNIATCRIDIASHNYEYGEYETHVYAYDKQGNYSSASYGKIIVEKDNLPPIISNLRIKSITNTQYTVECDVTDNKSIDRILFPAWLTGTGQIIILSATPKK